ncbi:hypothetical protein AC1031_006015 [Aphanomyces cochlioides]|nr:hypothetical protein AC1031_006015 [Aphanomyces cochlioides]
MSKSGCPRAKWNAEKDAYLVKLLIRQKDAGKQSDSGFKKEAWMAVLSKFNHRFACTLDKEKIKTRYNQSSGQLKGDWKLFQSLKNDSGFGWDPNDKKPTAPETVWTERMAAKPKPIQAKIRSIQMHGLDNYNGLAHIFEGSTAVGPFASRIGGNSSDDDMSDAFATDQQPNANDNDSPLNDKGFSHRYGRRYFQ